MASLPVDRRELARRQERCQRFQVGGCCRPWAALLVHWWLHAAAVVQSTLLSQRQSEGIRTSTCTPLNYPPACLPPPPRLCYLSAGGDCSSSSSSGHQAGQDVG